MCVFFPGVLKAGTVVLCFHELHTTENMLWYVAEMSTTVNSWVLIGFCICSAQVQLQSTEIFWTKSLCISTVASHIVDQMNRYAWVMGFPKTRVFFFFGLEEDKLISKRTSFWWRVCASCAQSRCLLTMYPNSRSVEYCRCFVCVCASRRVFKHLQ